MYFIIMIKAVHRFAQNDMIFIENQFDSIRFYIDIFVKEEKMKNSTNEEKKNLMFLFRKIKK